MNESPDIYTDISKVPEGRGRAFIRFRMRSGDVLRIEAENQYQPEKDLTVIAEAVVSKEMIFDEFAIIQPIDIENVCIDYDEPEIIDEIPY